MSKTLDNTNTKSTTSKNVQKPKAVKKGDSNPKPTHSMVRMNFLYQAAALLTKSKKANPGLATYYADNLLNVGKKSVTRVSPGLKKVICTRCHCPLVAGKTAKVRARSKVKVADGRGRLDMVGRQCGATKSSFDANKLAKN